jgi:photoactive yellow protein
MDFSDPDLAQSLATCDDARLDCLDFGVIRMTLDGVVSSYNALESSLAGLSPSRVLGKNFFTEVAPCTNNYLVASRFEECATLDERLPYVFTLRMRPRKVELRLLKEAGAQHQYVLVRNR